MALFARPSDQGIHSLYNALESVPPEILIEIFVLCTTSTDSLANLKLLRVSKLWREVVQSSPRIWQQLYLNDRSTITSARRQAELWMQKVYPLTFDVHLDVSQSSGLVLPLLSPLLPKLNCWRHFTMTGKREESIDLSGTLPEYVDPLVIAIQDPDQIDPEEEEGYGLPRLTFTSSSPDSEWFTMNAPYLAPLHFTTIVMTEYSLTILTQPRAVLGFLAACPALQVFFFTGWQHDDERLHSPLPVARLPSLRSLHLRSTCGTRSLLSHIDAPALIELHLSHLNVDFQLAGAVAEHGYLWEDGDSEDEANDFSRSKFSDHATGMGLRRLLLRSNPPLRVLDMDWSDMRTKDFTWVFGRLEKLESFFIEASDMSDKVIELLRPFRTGPPRINGRQQVRVRLPRLKSLELSNCNELSGDALLSVLSERIKTTDRMVSEDEWEGDTLEEVIIGGCENFTPRHASLLRKELGARLRSGQD
ncbi:hypothetical protein MVEN_00398500 [Mycena venus]|uniref:F-box domain-containing protein n=1 Tax=Mycena venus TaxID=2733690 RepID=A0A8H6YU41_9AGAR|nr:hypothetical protein MVEN_00398500 [Mycena venus]